MQGSKDTDVIGGVLSSTTSFAASYHEFAGIFGGCTYVELRAWTSGIGWVKCGLSEGECICCQVFGCCQVELLLSAIFVYSIGRGRRKREHASSLAGRCQKTTVFQLQEAKKSFLFVNRGTRFVLELPQPWEFGFLSYKFKITSLMDVIY